MAYQMRGLHIRLVHKKVSLCDIYLILRIDKTIYSSSLSILQQILAFELEKRKFIGKLDKLEELGFWKWMESKWSNKQYKKLDCTFTEFKVRVETDTGLKWSELATGGKMTGRRIMVVVYVLELLLTVYARDWLRAAASAFV